jgi:hypothetical protein
LVLVEEEVVLEELELLGWQVLLVLGDHLIKMEPLLVVTVQVEMVLGHYIQGMGVPPRMGEGLVGLCLSLPLLGMVVHLWREAEAEAGAALTQLIILITLAGLVGSLAYIIYLVVPVGKVVRLEELLLELPGLMLLGFWLVDLAAEVVVQTLVLQVRLEAMVVLLVAVEVGVVLVWLVV